MSLLYLNHLLFHIKIHSFSICGAKSRSLVPYILLCTTLTIPLNVVLNCLVFLRFDFVGSVMGEARAATTNEIERTATRMDDVKINERVVVWRVVNGERRRVRLASRVFAIRFAYRHVF